MATITKTLKSFFKEASVRGQAKNKKNAHASLYVLIYKSLVVIAVPFLSFLLISTIALSQPHSNNFVDVYTSQSGQPEVMVFKNESNYSHYYMCPSSLHTKWTCKSHDLTSGEFHAQVCEDPSTGELFLSRRDRQAKMSEYFTRRAQVAHKYEDHLSYVSKTKTGGFTLGKLHIDMNPVNGVASAVFVEGESLNARLAYMECKQASYFTALTR